MTTHPTSLPRPTVGRWADSLARAPRGAVEVDAALATPTSDWDARALSAPITPITPVGWWTTLEGVRLPLATRRCYSCAEQTGHDQTAFVSRVDGNSAFGYEPCCRACARRR